MAPTDEVEAKFRAIPWQAQGVGFEFAVERLIQALDLRGTTAVDAGANYGGHTATLLESVGPTGSVVAIEADPDIAATVAAWCQQRPNLRVVHAAVSNTVGEAPFLVAAEEKGYGSLFERPKYNVKVERTITIPVTTLDAVLAGETRPISFVKVDVEGAELLLIDGAIETLRHKRPLMAVEMDWCLHFAETPERQAPFFARFRDLGYEVRAISGRKIEASIPDEYVVLLVPVDRFDVEWLADVGCRALTEFIGMPSGWHLYRKFEK